MKKMLCFENLEFGTPIRLYQTGLNSFTVEYGDQVTKGLTYEKAAAELGQYLMHALACVARLRTN